jgi:hypothetical protein
MVDEHNHRVSWAAQFIAAVILLQSLVFKFGSSPESIYIFTELGAEPWGRYLTGTVELVAAGLLLHPATPVLGAALTLGIMGGAILSHLTVLGIEVQADHGLLFGLALITTASSLAVVICRRGEIGRYLGVVSGRRSPAVSERQINR